ncbi:MAG: hypothetical protein ABI680_04890, partial [Chthoniobacteraceae bacterium]
IGIIEKLTIATAGGNDRIEVTNLYDLTALSADMGDGDDSFKTEGFLVKGNAAFSMGAGLDNVEFDGLLGKITGDLNIADSADGLFFEFRAERVKIGGSVTLVGSAAKDTLTMTTDTVVKIGKQIDFTANGGNDRLVFGSQGMVTVGREAQGRSVIYHGGDGNDRIGIGASIVNLLGSVEMTGGAGDDTLDLDGLRVSVGKSRAGISAQLTGDDGRDQIDIQGSVVKIAGLLQIGGGAGEDLLDLSSVHRLTLKGGASFTGGAGYDEYKLGADHLRVKGDLFFDGGDDDDEIEIEANGIIKGSVIANFGGAVENEQIGAVTARSGLRNSLHITGAVMMDATGDAASADDFKLTNLKIGGSLSVLLGDGDSSLDMDNLNVAGAVTFDTRGGNDEVVLETDGNFGPSAFRQQTTIRMGSGDDILVIGDDSENNIVRFHGKVTAEGGESSDTRNDIGAVNEFGDSGYMETGFEILLPTEE